MASAAAFRAEICLLGDSITQEAFDPAISGFAAQLANEYRRKADVLNRGYSGYNTRLALSIAPHVFGSGRRYLFSTIFYGANDACLEAPQHLDPGEYAANLKALIASAAAVSGAVFVLTPPPLDTARWPNRNNEATGKIAATAAAVVAEMAAASAASTSSSSTSTGSSGAAAAVSVPVHCIDLHSSMLAASSWTSGIPAWHGFLSDGLHLSSAGHSHIFRAIMTTIATHTPALMPDAQALDFPIWRDVASLPEPAAAFTPAELAALHAVVPNPIRK